MQLRGDVAGDGNAGGGSAGIAHCARDMAATVVNGSCGAHGRAWVAAGIICVSEAQVLNQGRERHDVW